MFRTKNKKALEAIVNLQSYLPKEFGGITVDGKIADYGAKPFNLKTNLSVAKFPEVYQRVFEFINNPELQSTFKESKVSFKNLNELPLGSFSLLNLSSSLCTTGWPLWSIMK